MGARRWFDAAEHLAGEIAVRSPRSGLRLAGALGAVRNGLSRRWPPPAVVRDLFGVSPSRALGVAIAIGALEARNRAWPRLAARRESEALASLVRWVPPAGDLPAPAILVVFHIGAFPVITAALSAFRRPWQALAMVGAYDRGSDDDTATAIERSAGALRRLITTLEQGSTVVLPIDEPGATVPTTCLGRPLGLNRGPFVLARVTGAPIVPVVARWRFGGAVLEWFPALDRLGSEREQADALATWFSDYLRRRPGELALGLLQRLAAAG